MSRQATEERVATAIRFPRSLHDKLLTIADERDVSVTRLVVKATESYLEKLQATKDL